MGHDRLGACPALARLMRRDNPVQGRDGEAMATPALFRARSALDTITARTAPGNASP